MGSDPADPAAVVRQDAMKLAMFTATPGEDPLKVLARAQLYEEYIGAGAGSLAIEANGPLYLKKPRVDKG